MQSATKAVISSTLALALTACGGPRASTIVRIPATELPSLGPSTLRDGPAPPPVKTIDGSTHQITGPIDLVQINMKDTIVPIALPFKARVRDEQLEVLTDQTRTYATTNISFVQVQYGGVAQAQRRNATSAGLIAGGLLPLGLGAGLIYADSGCSGGGFVNLCGIGTILGAGFVLAGAGLFIAGISVAARSDPAPQRTRTTRIQPKLRLSPTSGTLSFDF